MHRLTKIGTVLVFMMAIAGVSAGIVAAQANEDSTPTPNASVATATPAAEDSGTPADGSTDEDTPATPEAEDDTAPDGQRSGDGHLCPDKEGDAAEESTTATTA